MFRCAVHMNIQWSLSKDTLWRGHLSRKDAISLQQMLRLHVIYSLLPKDTALMTRVVWHNGYPYLSMLRGTAVFCYSISVSKIQLHNDSD